MIQHRQHVFLFRPWSIFSVILLAIFLLTLPASAKTIKGKVVGIADGDTFTVLVEGNGERIRLYGVDCPEKAQPYGKAAKKRTSELVFDKIVEVTVRATDRYGRTVGDVGLPDGRRLGPILAQEGLAWWYQRYAPNDHDLKDYERTARDKKLGLWRDPDPIPPWKWRHSKKGRVEVNLGTEENELPDPTTEQQAGTDNSEPDGSCCKHCRKGKTCGDTCISKNSTCIKPKDCACDQ